MHRRKSLAANRSKWPTSASNGRPIQQKALGRTAWTAAPAATTAPVRVLPHIKRLDDCFGQFLVRVVCDCGACREIEPEALARLVGWSMTSRNLRKYSVLRKK
jgi:hypothetical protein